MIVLACSFVVRIVFAHYLAQEYLGLQTLFSSVLSMLSLMELGIGSAIVYQLYKPLAENDIESVKSIMRLYKRAYITIGILVAIVGCILAPNIKVIIEGAPDIPNLELYFLLFVANTSVSYFFSYKGSLITADQRNYIVTRIDCVFQGLQSAAQLAVLVITQNYIFFLLCMIAATLFRNITIVITSNRLYPYLREKNIAPLEKNVSQRIKKNVSALLIHKISSMVKYPLNSVLVSIFSGLNTLAIYGNYILVINTVMSLIDRAYGAVVASLGNIGVTESNERQNQVFDAAFFVNATLTGFATICLLPLFNPVILLMFGESYVFSIDVTILIVIWFYTQSMRSALVAYESAYGIFWELKWKSVGEMVFLLITAPIMTYFFGIQGLLIANIVLQIVISTFIEGAILFKYGLKSSMKPFLFNLAKYTLCTGLMTIACFIVASLLPGDPIIQIAVTIPLSMLLLALFLFIFRKSYGFTESLRIVKNVISMLRAKKQ